MSNSLITEIEQAESDIEELINKIITCGCDERFTDVARTQIRQGFTALMQSITNEC